MGGVRRWLSGTSWPHILGLVFFVMCVSVILSLGAERGTLRHAMPGLAGKAIVLALAARLLLHAMADGFRAVRQLPQRLAAWVRVDQANLLACLHWLARRPHAPAPAGQAISFMDKSAYATVIAMGLVSTFVDLPINAMIATVMSPDPLIQGRIHLLFTVLALYCLVWILGDRYQMQGAWCVLTGTHLDIRLGGRLRARLPRSAILRCEPIGQGGAALWCRQHGVASGDALVSTPADSATVMLEIDPAAGAMLTSWQFQRPAPRYLFLYLDQPSLLAAALANPAAPSSH